MLKEVGERMLTECMSFARNAFNPRENELRSDMSKQLRCFPSLKTSPAPEKVVNVERNEENVEARDDYATACRTSYGVSASPHAEMFTGEIHEGLRFL